MAIGQQQVPNINPQRSDTLSFSVHVLGEVKNPGIYHITPTDRLSEALTAAGGVNKTGSKRRIQIRRAGQATTFIDLTAYLANADLTQNPFLADNDVVFVPTKLGSFEIEGTVKRPGTYELVRPISLSAAIAKASGLAIGHSDQTPIRIVRYDKDEKEQFFDINASDKSALKKFTIQPGDIIYVSHIFLKGKKFDYTSKRIPGDNIYYPTINSNVFVIGAVTTPGPQPFHPNLKYSDYVNLAGPLNNSNLKKLKLIDAKGKRFSIKSGYDINAGDTIVVPERAFTATKTLSWFTAITTTILTTTVLVNQLKN